MHQLLILDTGESRADWLKARTSVITATQAAAIAGSHPYTKLIDVWNEKTDPDYDPDANRNKYLDERAKVGQDREQAILDWMSERPETGGPGAPFLPNRALVALPTNPRHASTPDGYKRTALGTLVLIECKTTQQDWAKDGLPQHIYDQCQWQIYTTDAVTVWIGAERYTWAKGTATLADTWVTKVHADPVRLAFLLAKVEQFEGWLRDGIAPESDIDLSIPPEFGFDDDEAEIEAKLADWEILQGADAAMDELAEIRLRTAADLARATELEGIIKAAVKAYDGRRIHLMGRRLIAKLVRGTKVSTNLKALDPDVLRSLYSWSETETVRIEINPEYVTPETAPTEKE